MEAWEKKPDRVFLYKQSGWTESRPCVVREIVEIKVPIRDSAKAWNNYTTKYKTQLGARIQYWSPECWKETKRTSEWNPATERFVFREVARPTWRFTAKWALVPFRELSHGYSASMDEWVASRREYDAESKAAEQAKKEVRPQIAAALEALGFRYMVKSYTDDVTFTIGEDLLGVLRDALAYRESMAEKVA